ncbi:hypothetical protein AMIS_45280 [Actinoplanes missouriensis 431]|uniref:Uncharacterized protein n=1 Tax=Actinoplanes missouriensis (strain ATCC 14538 / DSM 43046 / CBS 188.64 / JCM 3121 / NBRC 102363 / NCIMB 12654 / NRRL B-3342 / UNCC 431) TaxID=512565 RepID=I0H9R1_ACTM4|nr:hypothetical protein AMIS_45280 [Actinoplanes missouriensis 431]
MFTKRTLGSTGSQPAPRSPDFVHPDHPNVGVGGQPFDFLGFFDLVTALLFPGLAVLVGAFVLVEPAVALLAVAQNSAMFCSPPAASVKSRRSRPFIGWPPASAVCQAAHHAAWVFVMASADGDADVREGVGARVGVGFGDCERDREDDGDGDAADGVGASGTPRPEKRRCACCWTPAGRLPVRAATAVPLPARTTAAPVTATMTAARRRLAGGRFRAG